MSLASQNKGMWAWTLVQAIVAPSVLMFALLYAFYGFNEEGTRQAIRWSARISVALFCVAFVASSVQRTFKNSFTYWLLQNRKYIGISFAIVHLIHLFFLAVLQYFFHPVFNLAKTQSLVGGGLAYLFLVLMLLTSFERFSKHLTPGQWKWLHTIGGYWIWVIFFRSYLKRALTEYEYIPFVVLLGIVIVWRLAKFRPLIFSRRTI